MVYLVLLSATLIFTLQMIGTKAYNLHHHTGYATLFRFHGIHMAMAAVGTLVVTLIGGGMEAPLPETWLCAIAFGVLFILFFALYTLAMATGPLSFTTLCGSSSSIIPITIGFLFWNEIMTAPKIIGILLVLVTFYLCSTAGSGDGKKINSRWMVIAALMLVCNGSVATIQKLHPKLTDGAQVQEFYVIAFAVASLTSLLFYVLFRRFGKEEIPQVSSKLVLTAVGTGVCTCAGNLLLGLLSAWNVDASLIFPFTSGLQVIIATVLSAVLYKEKLTARSYIAIGVGIVALVLISV